MKKRMFLLPLAVSVSALLGISQADALAHSTDKTPTLSQPATLAGSASPTSQEPFVLQRANAAGMQVADDSSPNHASHASHSSHESHSSHVSGN
jgi:hypothetical protein